MACVLACVLLVTKLFALGLWYSGSLQARENHFLELVQGGFLALGCGVCCMRCARGVWQRLR